MPDFLAHRQPGIPVTSPLETSAQLDNPSRCCARDLPESRSNSCIGVTELCVVKDIEKFKSQLKRRFLWEAESLEKTEIGVPGAWLLKGIATHVALDVSTG